MRRQNVSKARTWVEYLKTWQRRVASHWRNENPKHGKCDSIFIISPFGKYLTHLQLCADFSFHFISSFHFIYVAASRLSTQARTAVGYNNQIYNFFCILLLLLLRFSSCLLAVVLLHIYAQPHFKSNKFCSFALQQKTKKNTEKRTSRNCRRKLCSFARFWFFLPTQAS